MSIKRVIRERSLPTTSVPLCEGTKAYTMDNCTVMVAREMNRWHLSIAHRNRYPTWDEIRDARYEFLPKEITVVMVLPPPSQYVNAHPNCFHLHECPEMHEGGLIKT